MLIMFLYLYSCISHPANRFIGAVDIHITVVSRDRHPIPPRFSSLSLSTFLFFVLVFFFPLFLTSDATSLYLGEKL